MQTQAMMTDTYTQEVERENSGVQPGSACSAGAPFAMVSIGPRSYEIAEVTADEASAIAFRTAGEQGWTALGRRTEDGWALVAAEILLLDPDVLFDFLQTHAVRTGTSEAPPYSMHFDTLGVAWSASLTQDRDGLISFGDEKPRHARLGQNAPSDGRARAILLLLSAYPDARTLFEPHISQWAQRIAQGVSVKPVF
ncbi:MAG: hypothetical protein ABF308_05010 [Phaeobacter gallaeciensis]|jgi:hypothetical protein